MSDQIGLSDDAQAYLQRLTSEIERLEEKRDTYFQAILDQEGAEDGKYRLSDDGTRLVSLDSFHNTEQTHGYAT